MLRIVSMLICGSPHLRATTPGHRNSDNLNPGWGITERKIHLQNGSKLFKRTETAQDGRASIQDRPEIWPPAMPSGDATPNRSCTGIPGVPPRASNFVFRSRGAFQRPMETLTIKNRVIEVIKQVRMSYQNAVDRIDLVRFQK